MLAEETSNSLTLKFGAITEVVVRSEIVRSETSARSLMPEGFENVLSPQQLADVLAWIRAG